MGTTYLTIVSGCQVNTHQAENHGHESRHARNRIDLTKGEDKVRVLGRVMSPKRKWALLRTHIVQR